MSRIEYSSVFEGEGETRPFKAENTLFSQIILPWADSLPYSNGGILELAAGQGIEASLLAYQGFKTTSLEPSHSLGTNSYHQNYVSGLAERIPFKETSFSGLLLKDALVFLSPEVRADMFAEAKRVLVAGGSFLVVSQRSDALRIYFLPKNSAYPQKETFYTNSDWEENAYNISLQGKILAIEYITILEELLCLAAQYGFDLQFFEEYEINSEYSKQNRWTHNKGFIANFSTNSL